MRLATLRAAAGTSAACDAGDGWRELPYADVGALLRDPAWRERVSSGALCREPGRDAFQPLIPAPGKIVCCGHNYTEHIRELGRELPSHPTLFAKFADTLCGPYDDIEVSAAPEMVDWEAELAVVVGARVRGADRDAAREAIAGYTVANDISMRDWQRRTSQWLQGKAFSGTTPLGPVLVTADSIDPSGGLEISCSVNGEIVQRADTATLVFDAPELVSYISRFTTLNPGDVILTGTPGGVGAAMDPPRFLGDDDLLTTTISGIGTLQNRIRRCRPASHPHSAASHPHSTKKHEERGSSMNDQLRIDVVPVVTRAGEEHEDTGQSGGAHRVSGVSIQHTPATKIWYGKVSNKPGYRSLPHHHGEAETGGYVLKGRGRIFFGEGYRQWVDMTEGDFVFVPPFMPHVEVNMSVTEELVWLTTRTPDNIVVNLDDVDDASLEGYRRA